MRKGGTTALFCAFRLEYNRNIKKFLQADLIFLCTALFLCTAIFLCTALFLCTAIFLCTILLHTIFLRTGLISMSIPNRRCVLP